MVQRFLPKPDSIRNVVGVSTQTNPENSEAWRPVFGWPYEVSDQGRVRRTQDARGTSAGRVLRANPSRGYPLVRLAHGSRRRTFPIHRLVAHAFIGPAPEGREVNHVNGDKRDNRAENLQYLTRRENIDHALDRGLIRSNRKMVTRDNATEWNAAVAGRLRDVQGQRTQDAFAQDMGTTQTTVSRYLRRDIPNSWRFLANLACREGVDLNDLLRRA